MCSPVNLFNHMNFIKAFPGFLIGFFRILLVVPVAGACIGLINWCLVQFLSFLYGLGTFWMVVVLFFAGSFLWGAFKVLAAILAGLVSRLSPFAGFGIWTLVILGVINCINLIYFVWTRGDDYSFWECIAALFASAYVLELTWAIVSGALASWDEY